jgi:hypothetical protein
MVQVFATSFHPDWHIGSMLPPRHDSDFWCEACRDGRRNEGHERLPERRRRLLVPTTSHRLRAVTARQMFVNELRDQSFLDLAHGLAPMAHPL